MYERGAFFEAAKLPLETAWRLAGYVSKTALKASVAVTPKSTQRDFARRLAAEGKIAAAIEAIEETHIGKQLHISDMEFDGRARLARLAIEAADSTLIPPDTTDEIAELAVNAGVDPNYEPLLEDDEQRRFREVYGRSQKVVDLLLYRRNAL